MALQSIFDPRRVQETLAKTLAGVVRVLVVVAVQYAARGNEDAGDALADHDQRHAAPFAEVHAREGGDVLGLPVNDAACRVAGGQAVKTLGHGVLENCGMMRWESLLRQEWKKEGGGQDWRHTVELDGAVRSLMA